MVFGGVAISSICPRLRLAIFSRVSLIPTANLAVPIFMRCLFTRGRKSVGTSSGDIATPFQIMSRSWASASGPKDARAFASFGMANTRYNVEPYGGSANRVLFSGAPGLSRELGPIGAPDVPVPLRLDVQHGDADIEQVGHDIMGLTKLNYNACRPGDRLPVTIGFSDKVGEILIGNSGLEAAHPQFKYYI